MEKNNSTFDVLVIGAGPSGLASAIEAHRAGFRSVLIEKGCLVNSLFHYPANMTFFTTPELLEIGDIPFPSAHQKPTREEAVRMVVESAGRCLVLFSGGEMEGDEDIIGKARVAMDAGATGLIFGRNIWQRSHDEALAIGRQIREMMMNYGA